MRHLLSLLFLTLAILSGGRPLSAAETFSFSSATYSGAEGTVVVVTVTRSGSTDSAADVSYATTSGGTATAEDLLPGPIPGHLPGMGDYTPTNGTLSFTSGHASLTFTVGLLNDQTDEGDETVFLTLSAPSSGYDLGVSSATITITDVPQMAWGLGTINSSPVTASLTFSEPVSGLTKNDFLVTNGRVSAVTAIPASLTVLANSSYSVNIVPAGQGAVTVTLPANSVQDASGHGNRAGSVSFTYDSVGPTCTLSSAAPNPTNNQQISFSAVFSEDLLGTFNTAKITVTNGSFATITGGPVDLGAPPGPPSDPRTYTIVVNAIASGPVTVKIESGAITDTHGNANIASATYSITYHDEQSPAVLSIGSSTPNGLYGWGSHIGLVVQFSEPVTLTGGHLLVPLNSGETVSIAPFTNNNQAQAVYVVGSSVILAVADLDNAGPLSLESGAALTDLSGNPADLALPPTSTLGANKDIALVAFDAPRITQISSTSAEDSYKLGETINVTVTFSEAMHFSVAGPLSTFNLSLNSSATLSAIYSGPGDSDPFSSISMDYTIGYGQSSSPLLATEVILHDMDVLVNASGVRLVTELPSNNISPGKNIIVDGKPPQVVVTSVASDPTSAKTIPVTVTFSEPVTGFDVSDITTTGTITSFAGSGAVYTFTLELLLDATTTVSIDNDVASDAVGNLNMGTGSMGEFNRTYDAAVSGSSESSGSSGCGVGSGLASLALGLLTLFMALRLRRSSMRGQP